MRSILIAMMAAACLMGCGKPPPEYGTESPLFLPGTKRQVWAVAPAINLSGQQAVDPILQADLVFEQLQQVRGIVVIPVNRVAEVYASLRLDKVQSEDQAALVCDLLGADALVVPTVTIYDPYNPPKFGATVQTFLRPGSYARPANVDPRELARSAAPMPGGAGTGAAAQPAGFVQAVGMFDAANGSVLEAVQRYAKGRNDPVGPYAYREYLVSMDRYCGFVYHELIRQIVESPRLRRATM